MKISEILNELDFYGSQCTKDCSGHAAGHAWKKQDKNKACGGSHSPSFNKGCFIAQAQQQNKERRKQGGGKVKGQTSQSRAAIRKRQQRANKKNQS